VFIDDVGRVLADAALRSEAATQLFELGGPEVMSLNRVIEAGLDALGRKRFLLHQPVVIGKVLGTLAALLPLPNLPLSADAVDFLNQPAVADLENLEKVLQPRLTPLREGLATYLKPG
jgi:NADH dehydrogenase